MKHIIIPVLVIISLYIYSCANQGSPTGGPRDTIPPSLITSLPESKALNYTQKEFQFEFDERVSADQLTSKLIITPRTEIKFKTFIKKNRMTLTFEESFEDSTTYTLNFADGVVDITEKNPVENFSFAFSTGPVIDSIYITGTIKNLYNNQDEKNILIALFDITDTLNLFTGKPKYFTKTNESGKYKIENIKNGYYKLYAFLDDDNNLTNNPSTETHGFLSDTLDLNTSKDSVDLKIQLIDASEPKFIRSKNTGLYFDILYNKYCKSYFLKKVDSSSQLNIPPNNLFKENTTIRFYKDDSFDYETDSLQLIVNFSDSLNNQLEDTVFVKFKESKRKPQEMTMNVLPTTKNINKNLTLKFQFNKPIKTFNPDSIALSYDTLQNITIPDSIFTWNHTKTKLIIPVALDPTYIPNEIEKIKKELAYTDSINALLKPDTTESQPSDTLSIDQNEENSSLKQRGSHSTNQVNIKNQIKLYVPKATFISIENDSSEIQNKQYTFKDNEEYGVLSGKITTDQKSYFLQLTDPKYNVVKEQKNPVKFRFNTVKPGKYTFRILIDRDGDGKWSPGNILKNIEPEPIWFYPDLFDLRANWEVENLDISF